MVSIYLFNPWSHPTLQTIIVCTFFSFFESFSPVWIRIHIANWNRIQSSLNSGFCILYNLHISIVCSSIRGWLLRQQLEFKRLLTQVLFSFYTTGLVNSCYYMYRHLSQQCMVFPVVGSIALPGNLLEALARPISFGRNVYSRELAVHPRLSQIS